MNYRREIDGLRALAILPVILFHSDFYFISGGFVGVDIFFVISGYLITSIIVSEIEQSKFSLVNFYERRARRILPALFFVMLLCLPFAWFLLLPHELKNFSQSLIAVSTFSSNFLFWRTSGYFDVGTDLRPLLHTWSLAVEEQFYLIFPIFLTMFWSLGKNKVLQLILLVACFSLALAHWGALAKPTPNFYLLPTRIWEMLIGAFASFAYKNYSESPYPYLNEIASAIGLLLILTAIFIFDKNTPFPSLYTVVPTIGALLVILFAQPRTLACRFLSNSLLVGIGLVSYSAYLWHQPILAFAKIITSNRLDIIVKIFVLLLIGILSILSWRFVEKPFRNPQKFSKRTIFTLAFCGIVFFISIGLFVNINNGFPKREEKDFQRYEVAIKDWWFPGSLQKGALNNLYLIDKNKPIDILFFGDSHAEQYAPLAVEIGKKKNINIGFFTGGGCPTVPNLYDDKHPQCKTLFNQLERVLADNHSIYKVIISSCFNCYYIYESKEDSKSAYNYYYYSKGQKLYFKNNEGKRESLNEFFRFLKEIKKKYSVTVILDNPLSENFDPKLHERKFLYNNYQFDYAYKNHSLEKFYIDSETKILNQSILDSILKLGDIDTINTLEIVCPDSLCVSLTNSGEFIYKDHNHLRPFFLVDKFYVYFDNLLFRLNRDQELVNAF